MILYRTFIFCNADGCREKISIGGIPSLDTISTVIRNKGWKEILKQRESGGIDREHFCPACQKKTEENNAA